MCVYERKIRQKHGKAARKMEKQLVVVVVGNESCREAAKSSQWEGAEKQAERQGAGKAEKQAEGDGRAPGKKEKAARRPWWGGKSRRKNVKGAGKAAKASGEDEDGRSGGHSPALACSR